MNTILVIKLGSTYPHLSARQGDFEDWIIQRLKMPTEKVYVVNAVAGQTLPEDGFGGAILSGSHSMVTDRLDWSERTAEWLRRQVDRKTPILGICYGHQLLTHSLGGVVGASPNGGEFGNQRIHLNDAAKSDSLFSAMPVEFDVHCCHLQSVLKLPPDAVCLGGNTHESNHIVRLAENCWSVQFHPEFDAQASRYYIKQNEDALSKQGLDAKQLYDAVCPTPESYDLISRFAAKAII